MKKLVRDVGELEQVSFDTFNDLKELEDFIAECKEADPEVNSWFFDFGDENTGTFMLTVTRELSDYEEIRKELMKTKKDLLRVGQTHDKLLSKKQQLERQLKNL